MATNEESQFISQFLTVFSGSATKFPATYISPDLAPNWTSKRATFTRPAKPVKKEAPAGTIPVTIKSLKSGQYTVNVSPEGTILDLKQALQDSASIDINSQRLVLKGKALIDSKTLSEYGIVTDSVVHLFSKAVTPGSVPSPTSTASAAATTAATASPTTDAVVPDLADVTTKEPSVTAQVPATIPEDSVPPPVSANLQPANITKPVVTSYRGLSEESTSVAKTPEFWYDVHDFLVGRLENSEDAQLVLKGFLGQYRDLVGNAGTKEIENEIKKR